MWKDDTDTSEHTQIEAKTYCNNMNYQGYNDWRLATYQELTYLLDYSDVDNQRRSEVNYLDWTWSATDVINLGDETRGIYLFSSSAKNNAQINNDGMHKSKCVRNINSATTTYSNRFIRINDIVNDTKTGLEWQDNKTLGEFLNERRNWKDSINYCSSLVLNDKNDWRLPNINEVISLRYGDTEIDYNGFEPLDHTSSFWTSTTNSKDITEGVWYRLNYLSIRFGLSADGNDGKDYLFYTRCIRGGE